MGRPKDSEKHRYWEAQLRAWQRSGLTQAEFCRRQGIRPKRFGSWKRRLGVEQQGKDSPVRFVAVAIRPEAQRQAGSSPLATVAAALTVVTGAGYRIEVGDGFTPTTLTSLIATLGGV